MSVNNSKKPLCKVRYAREHIRLPTFSANAVLPGLIGLLAVIFCATAVAATPFHIENRRAIDLPPSPPADGQHMLSLTIANIADWNDSEIADSIGIAAGILAQCKVRVDQAELLRITVPESHRHFDTPRSRELAAALALPKPTLYFSDDTRQHTPFDAEAIGRGNSRSRPELTDTVWIARGARDLGLVIAHELAHVLMNSSEHDHTPGNLMAESTDPANTQLTAAQCATMRATGSRNGLLRPGVN